MQRLLRFLLVSLSALLIYFLILPWLALLLDHRFGFIWRLPFWIEPIAAFLIFCGILLFLRYAWLQVFQKNIVREPSESSAQTVQPGLLNCSHNTAIFSAWFCGTGLAFLLRSPCLLGFVVIIMVILIFCLQRNNYQNKLGRFINILLPNNNFALRLIMLLLIASVTVAGIPSLNIEKQSPLTVTEPAILVQIRCKPGTASLWQADFDQHIKPAIEEVIARGNTYTGFQFIKATLPSQSFDFMLLYTGKTFAGLDKPVPPPQYVALFQREGSLRALSLLKEMLAYEDQVNVTIVYLERKR
jgi:hypothetical protein